MKKSLNKILITLAFTVCFLSISAIVMAQEFFEVRTYQITSNEQEKRMDSYLQNALLPALHKAGLKNIGVFKPFTDTGSKKIIMFIPYKNEDQFFSVPNKLSKDATYANSGKEAMDAAFDKPLYARMQKVLLQAFSGMPKAKAPALKAPKSERIYELRSYESATEKLADKKIAMFNNGEMGIFSKLNFNAIFYGKVLAGSNMPNLMYMTSFENKEDRDAHWKAFSADPDWKKMSSDTQYENTVSKIDIQFLRPTDYSDL